MMSSLKAQLTLVWVCLLGNFEIVILLPCSNEWALISSFSSQHSLICPGSFLSLTILRAPCSLGASLFFSLFFGIPWLHLVERSANQSQSPNRLIKTAGTQCSEKGAEVDSYALVRPCGTCLQHTHNVEQNSKCRFKTTQRVLFHCSA